MTKRIRYYHRKNIQALPQYRSLSSEDRLALDVVSRVLPFRVNNYVTDELIRWSDIPHDPIYQLTFLQQNMLAPEVFDAVAEAVAAGLSDQELKPLIEEVRSQLNPHPAGQLTDNVPSLDSEEVPGVQHKYRETVLLFPAQGQTCHSYCTFCFRWPQFTGTPGLKFATDESRRFLSYLRRRSTVTDVLFTGGDPMVMNARRLRAYIEPLLEHEFDHIQTIRIGTKSVAYWPYRYISDRDSDDVLRLFEKVVQKGKHLAIMAHYNHWAELSTWASREALRRIRRTGAVIRTQSPLIRHINDRPEVWARMWREQVRLGCIPYYMFVERDTGARGYFSVPLVRAWEICQDAYQQVSGLSRTVRGPSMSAHPGKVCLEGVAEVRGRRVFVLTMLQARNPEFVKRPFFARYDPKACWLDDLEPAFGEASFFFEEEEYEQAAS